MNRVTVKHRPGGYAENVDSHQTASPGDDGPMAFLQLTNLAQWRDLQAHSGPVLVFKHVTRR